MKKLHVAAAAIVGSLLIATVAVAPASADVPSTAVIDTGALPSTIALPAFGKVKTYTYAVPIQGETPGIRYYVTSATLTQGTRYAPIQVDAVVNGSTVAVTFSAQGGNPYGGTLGGTQTLSVTLSGEDDSTYQISQQPTATKNILLVAHDAKPYNVRAGSTVFRPHKKFVIGGYTSISGIGATASLYLEKKGSKHYSKIGSAKIKLLHYDNPDSQDAGYFRISTKKLAAGKIYVKVTGHSSPATAKSKVKKFAPRSAGGFSLR